MDNWDKVDAKDILKEAIYALELRDKICNLALKGGRAIDESDLQTITRIIDEHTQLIKILLSDEGSIVYAAPRELFNRAMQKLTMYKTIVKFPEK